MLLFRRERMPVGPVGPVGRALCGFTTDIGMGMKQIFLVGIHTTKSRCLVVDRCGGGHVGHCG